MGGWCRGFLDSKSWYFEVFVLGIQVIFCVFDFFSLYNWRVVLNLGCISVIEMQSLLGMVSLLIQLQNLSPFFVQEISCCNNL